MPDIPEHGNPGSPAADMEAFVAESIHRVFLDTNTNHIPIGDWKMAPASRAGTLPSKLPEGEYTLAFSVTDTSAEAVLTSTNGMTYDAATYIHHSLLVSIATHEEHAPKNQLEARRMGGKWTNAEFKN